MASERTALIVGAGIGGLAAAIGLKAAGWRVRVFERAAHARELGFALLLASNAVASLQRLGIAQEVIDGGWIVNAGELRGSAGRLLRRFDTTKMRHLVAHLPVVVLRPVLHGALLDALGLDHLALESEVAGFSVENGTPILQLTNGRDDKGDVLIAADGVGSIIRRALHPDEAPPRASGLWAVRGVAYDLAPALLAPTGGQYFGRGTEGGVARAAERAVYWYLSIPAHRTSASRDPHTLATRCADDFDERFKSLVVATRREDMRLDELLDREPIGAWGRGPVTLLGDAAHPMLPHAGQGAAQALEDAVALGHALGRNADVETALRRYEQVRAQRTRRIVLLARRNACVGSIESAAGRWLRDTAIRWMPASMFVRAYVEFGHPPPVGGIGDSVHLTE